MRTHKRTKATSIPPAVKYEVTRRDGGRCIFCRKYGDPVAHVIPRSQGGLGIPENIITACWECHQLLDNSPARKKMQEYAIRYLTQKYGTWSREEVIYDKWAGIKTESP